MHEQFQVYEQLLFESFGPGVKLKSACLISAGNYNQGVQLETSRGLLFVKLNFDHEQDILVKESEGLAKLSKSTFLKIPKTYGAGRVLDYNYLVSEFIPGSRPSPEYWEELGLGLADLHLHHQPRFGFDNDNFIASLPQKHNPLDNWTDFFIENRLEPLLGKAYFD
jgi:fructosamine-3-kinase